MQTTSLSPFRQRQQGAITIVVVLMLLVLLMVAAFGMSRDALRELGISGTSRQGAEVFNESDTGINWSVFWMYPPNQQLSTAQAGGQALSGLMDHMLADPTTLGKTGDLTYAAFTVKGAGNPDMSSTSGAKTSSFDISLIQMGHMPTFGTSQNVASISAIAPLVWSVRSHGQVAYTGASTFQHDREAWITTPIGRSAN